jgi:hypothetical protein
VAAGKTALPGTYLLQGYELFASSRKSSTPTGRGVDWGREGSIVDTNTPTGGTNVIVHGFYAFDGVWSYDIRQNLIGNLFIVAYDVDTGLPVTNAVSFKGKVSGTAPNQRLSLVASTSFGKVAYKGLRLIGVTNLTGVYFDGSWYGIKKQNGLCFQEFFTLTPAFGTLATNIYTIQGMGPSYAIDAVDPAPAGQCVAMVSRQNRIGFSLFENTAGSNYLHRSSVGSFKKQSVTAKTKGSIEPYGAGNIIKFNATRYSQP